MTDHLLTIMLAGCTAESFAGGALGNHRGPVNHGRYDARPPLASLTRPRFSTIYRRTFTNSLSNIATHLERVDPDSRLNEEAGYKRGGARDKKKWRTGNSIMVTALTCIELLECTRDTQTEVYGAYQEATLRI